MWRSISCLYHLGVSWPLRHSRYDWGPQVRHLESAQVSRDYKSWLVESLKFRLVLRRDTLLLFLQREKKTQINHWQVEVWPCLRHKHWPELCCFFFWHVCFQHCWNFLKKEISPDPGRGSLSHIIRCGCWMFSSVGKLMSLYFSPHVSLAVLILSGLNKCCQAHKILMWHHVKG